MLDNMAGKAFHQFKQFEYLVLLVPLVAYHGVGVAAETEIVITRVVTGAMLAWYYARIMLLSVQWC